MNKTLWNERTKHHLTSDFYDVDGFLNGNNPLNKIELELLGDLSGKSLLHLQCHFGQDTLSLARMGAHVTGVDLSDESIATARDFASKLSIEANFICCDLYELPQHLDGNFDVVFSSYGTIGWLPDLKKWANVVSRFLKPGGMFVFAEFHPAVWMFDNDFRYVQYSYFNQEPILEVEEGTYGAKDAVIALKSVGWNHSLDEVLQNLLDAGLTLQTFQEFNWSPYNVFPEMIEVAPKQYQLKSMPGKLPLIYALKMLG